MMTATLHATQESLRAAWAAIDLEQLPATEAARWLRNSMAVLIRLSAPIDAHDLADRLRPISDALTMLIDLRVQARSSLREPLATLEAALVYYRDVLAELRRAA